MASERSGIIHSDIVQELMGELAVAGAYLRLERLRHQQLRPLVESGQRQKMAGRTGGRPRISLERDQCIQVVAKVRAEHPVWAERAVKAESASRLGVCIATLYKRLKPEPV